MPGDPQPVIYYHGNKSLFDLNSKELSERLIGLQNTAATKSDDTTTNTGSFSSICRGFCFVSFDSIIEEEQERATFYSDPCLYLYWTDCCDQEQYKSSVKPEITKWIEEVEKVHANVGWLIIYCITRESKSKRKQLGERIKNDFCSKPEQYSLLKLSSSDTSRMLDSWSALVTKINTLSFNTFQKHMQPRVEEVNKMTGNVTSEGIYSYFLSKLDVAIGYEMCCQYEQALWLYNELHLLLEHTIAKHSTESRSQYPQWLKKMTSSWYQCWDCPDLTHPEKAWKYIVPIHSGSAPLLVIRTFIFMREASLLGMLCRSWLLAERALQVLHSAARETRAIKFNYPEGVFEAWAYMTCMETVSAILNQVSRANLEDMTSSLLLIRASLWEYGLQKLHKLGKICQLVPTNDVHDDHLISRIASGITQHSSNASNECEDHGQLLIETLKSKQSFTSKYLELGEMVIGAFKHAGRKRTAFTVGLQMAKFHMELGLVNEAEQLLNDMCSLYCPEQWTMFSANAVSLLAECQKSLNLDAKYLRSLLLLTVLPPVVGTSHDPNKCLDEIIQVSKSIQSDGALDWSPLFSVVKVMPDHSEYLVSNTVTVTVSLLYHGQKDLAVDGLSLLMRTSIKSLIQSPDTSGGPSICSGLVHTTTLEDNSPTSSAIPPENLYDLDIDLSYSDSSDYRPLNDQSQAKKTITETFSSYSLERASTGMDGTLEEENNESEFVVSTANIVLHPGENELKLHGEPATSGQYYGRKLTLSVGKLSFVSMVTSMQWSKGVPVLLKPIDISFGLDPKLGAFYAGIIQNCKIRLKTGLDNPIPQDSVLNLSCSTGIRFIPEPGSTDCLSEITLSLPAIDQNSEWSEDLLVYLPSIYKTPKILVGEDDFAFSTLKAPSAWNHEIMISCQWLMPPHVATLRITSPEPLSVDHQLCCTPDRSFLQFTVTSHWPHGVKLGEEKLSVPKSLSSESIQVLTPEVLWNEESFSYLWELQNADINSSQEPADVRGLFDLSSLLVVDNDKQDNLSVNHKYPFALPGVNALYCIECSIEPASCDRVIEGNLCQLKIIIRCCSPLGTDCPKKFHYTVLYDKSYWHIPHGVNGTAPIEKASRTVQIKVDIVPQMYGELPLPTVIVTDHCRRRASVKGSVQEDVFVPVDKSLVYNSSCGMRMCVYSDSRPSPC